MKKKLLFIMPSLSSGGGERSLVNLMSMLNYDEYDVDLFLLNHEGLFMSLIPEQVNLLPLTENYRRFARPLLKSAAGFIRQGEFRLAYHRCMFSLKNRLNPNTVRREQYSWKHLSVFIENLPKTYDVAIGFMEKLSIYLAVDKTWAVSKVGWIHNDYDQMGMDAEFDEPYFRKLQSIVTVSEECEEILKKRFPQLKEKFSVIHNIVSPATIKQLSEQTMSDSDSQQNVVSLLSIGRLHYQKAFELAIEACRKLVDKGYPVHWRIIGEGEEREKLEGMIRAHRLEKHFTLMGIRPNPYPYLKMADIYVQTSRFEGKSIAIDEAKILHKPIVVTRFNTAKDQIEHGVNGLIVDMNAEAVADGIERLIRDQALQRSIVGHLSGLSLGTEKEIHKFYKLLG